jgi:hypothetical protein
MQTATKTLLLGSTASLVMISAGHAAELPVKAKPVEYVKVCSLYGAGFYYMPGTDMCLKMAGYLRVEAAYGVNGNMGGGPFAANTNSRATNNLATRERGYVNADAREQTAYGVARAYINVGINSTDTGGEANSGQFSANRAFIQWAGFTAGLAVSAYDAVPWALYNYRAGSYPNENTGDQGWWTWQYTALFGGGFSATLAAEERRMEQIVDNNGTGTVGAGSILGTIGSSGGGYGGWQAPDIVGNVRADETWGHVQIMAAAHEDNAALYGVLPATGHPADAWGWAAGAGAVINVPAIAQGDNFAVEFNYSQGALGYLDHTPMLNLSMASGNAEAYGVRADCVYGGTIAAGATGCEMTTAWLLNAGYDHYWTPQWHQSLSGTYMHVSYDALANNMLCASEGFGAGAGSAAVAAAGCNNDWSIWAAASRLQWDVTKTFYVGFEALYTQLVSAHSSTGFTNAVVGLPSPSVCSTGTCSIANEGDWEFTIRMHKDFLP